MKGFDTTFLLDPERDPMGAAIDDYERGGRGAKLRVFSSQFDEDELPLSILFRTYNEMPRLEQEALQLAHGKILDVGAGSGCHALALQDMGKDVCAIDISSLSVDAMRRRGVKSARLINLFDPRFIDKFDTILMLMNGSGLIGCLENMPQFFAHMKNILLPGGEILMDSSDLSFIFEDEDGVLAIDLNDKYYGQIDYVMQYKDVKGGEFDCLYVDFETLKFYAESCGFNAELISEGDHYDYLARLTVKE